ncbi:alpha-amylase family protein [Undibacterium luofuense]|nr:alpha-amylase family protein [Undibacterium luofuense]
MEIEPVVRACRERFLSQTNIALQRDIDQRFQENAPLLFCTLHSLYGARFHSGQDFADWCLQLTEGMAKQLAERPQDLLALDHYRQLHPDWFTSQHMLGYCAYADRFGGTLSGVEQHIPHLQDLGVTYLHLLPFLKARAGENDGGFAVSDFAEIAPALGNMADLKHLTSALRSAGISLCSDLVLNHVADDHPWAIAARNGSEEHRSYFYHYPDRTIPDQFEKTLPQIFPQVAPGNFTYIEEMQSWVWTTFYPYQWDLNYSNPAVFAEMSIAMLHLANQGIEAFRLDSTAFLWKRPGTSCMNEPEAHQILQCLRAIAAIVVPGVILKAEAIVPTRDLPPYLGSLDGKTKECHMAYHSSLMAGAWVAVAEQNVSLLSEVIRNTPELPQDTSWLNYVRCHDDIGWNVLRPDAANLDGDVQQRLSAVSRFYAGLDGSFASGASFQASDPSAVHGTVGMTSALCGLQKATSPEARQAALNRMLLLYGLSLCFGGMPLIYMGDEFAQGNDDTYTDRAAHRLDARWLHRPLWSEQLASASHDDQTVSGQFRYSLQTLLRWRRSLPQLAAPYRRQVIESNDPALLIMARIAKDNAMLFVGNFSDQRKSVVLPTPNALFGRSEDEQHQQWKSVNGNLCGDTLDLEPWGQIWLTQDNESVSGVQK